MNYKLQGLLGKSAFTGQSEVTVKKRDHHYLCGGAYASLSVKPCLRSAR